MSVNQNKHLDKFLELLEVCYDGKLKAFSDEFSKYDDVFYEKFSVHDKNR